MLKGKKKISISASLVWRVLLKIALVLSIC